MRFLGLAQYPVVREEDQGAIVGIAHTGAASVDFEIVEIHVFPFDPACVLIWQGGKLGGNSIFSHQPMPDDFELERADSPKNRVAGQALPIEEQLDGAFFGQLGQPLRQLPALEGICQAHADKAFGREAGERGKFQGRSFTKRVADAQYAVVPQSENVPRDRFLN